MSTIKTDILVYAHWLGMKDPKLIGVLSAQQAKGKKAFSFEYADDWMKSAEQVLLDPDIGWYKGQQYPAGKENFGIFFDSMPDTWGRTLMKRRAAQKAKAEGKATPNLYDIDFLLGVCDECRMGALRFKRDPNGPFLDNNPETPIPPLSSIRELQHAAYILESGEENEEIKKWLSILIAPGSSLGGARPKANVIDGHGDLWIAKFPSKGDTVDKAAWEFLAYKLALQAGIEMSASRIERISEEYHTFFTKRFDRQKKERIHFASAMTMTGNNEETIKEKSVSYLDIAEFIQYSGAENKKDLEQLWKRIVFNIALSNTDDHLRNHGFLLSKNGWILSPAFDINPSIDKNGLALNIDTDNNSLDFELAKDVGVFFQLTSAGMDSIISDVKKIVSNWKAIAKDIGISKSEQEVMASAFRY
ncbi:MAG: type II toxin-antitoxin system HipA family toxin [Mariniphaga sp.]|jgi:serine/threonine-protein kinase HipA|nr:type II toxin-antitoxin system HipA family toxin [Mariniphaga sp.]